MPKHEAELPMRRHFVETAPLPSARVDLHCAIRGSRFPVEHIRLRQDQAQASSGAAHVPVASHRAARTSVS